MKPTTLLDKLWQEHEIMRREDGASLLWVDRHLVHEGSHHAFAKLAERGAKVAEPGLTLWGLSTTTRQRTVGPRAMISRA